MTSESTIRLKFWGTRGSIPCPGPDTVRYGGNTTCFEVTCGDRRIIIDAGTGVRLLGKKIMIEEGNLLNADLFFTHTHMDHIQGLPFFAPLYNPDSDVRLHAGHLGGQKYDLLGIIGTMLMKDPVFPVPSALIEKACSFNDYPCGKVFTTGTGRLHLDNSSIDNLSVRQDGNGPIILKGKEVSSLELIVIGDGLIFAQDLPVDRARVLHRGNANVEINPLSFLDSRIFGQGNILLHSKPENIVVSQKGTGKVIDVIPDSPPLYDMNATRPVLFGKERPKRN